MTPRGRYFTGKSCPKGHVAERFAGNRECVECARLRSINDPRKAARTKASATRNQAKRTEAQKKRYWSNAEASREYHNKRRMAALKEFLAKEAQRRAKHRVKRAVYAARRRAALLRATPQWADDTQISEYYALAAALTAATGTRHEVDHIVPLQGRNVCGLHVETNLQVLTQSENASKHNRLIDAALAGPSPP